MVHFGLFFVYAIFFGLSREIRRGVFLGATVGTTMALFTEWMQSYVPGRQPDLFDGLADVCGVAIGLLAVYMWHRKKEGN